MSQNHVQLQSKSVSSKEINKKNNKIKWNSSSSVLVHYYYKFTFKFLDRFRPVEYLHTIHWRNTRWNVHFGVRTGNTFLLQWGFPLWLQQWSSPFKVVQFPVVCTAGSGKGVWRGNSSTRIPLNIILNCVYFLRGTFGLLSLTVTTLLQKKKKKNHIWQSKALWQFPWSSTRWCSLARAAWVWRRRRAVGWLGLSWSVRRRIHLIVVGVWWRRTLRKHNFVQQVQGFKGKLGLSFHSRLKIRKSEFSHWSLVWPQHHLVDKSMNCGGISPIFK